MSLLSEKRALVTGAASGIGAAIGRRFATEGAAVALVDKDGEGAAAVAGEVKAAGGYATAISADLVSGGDLSRALDEALAALGGPDVLVNCAGVGQRPKPIEETTDDEFDEIFAVNVRSVFLLTRAALGHLNRSDEPVVINIASSIMVRPRPGYAAYIASKGAVASLTRALALELAPKNIRVVGLCPAASDTPMLVEFMGGENTPDSRDSITKAIPMGRLVTPDEVAAVAAWAASSDARMVTGELISIDGGRGL